MFRGSDLIWELVFGKIIKVSYLSRLLLGLV